MKRRQRLKALDECREFCAAYESYQVVMEAMNQRANGRDPELVEQQLVDAARNQVLRHYGTMRVLLGMKSPTDHKILVAELLEKFEYEETKRNAQTEAKADIGRIEAPSGGSGKPTAVSAGVARTIAGNAQQSGEGGRRKP